MGRGEIEYDRDLVDRKASGGHVSCVVSVAPLWGRECAAA